MSARVESEPAWSTADIFGRVNILQKSPFILKYARIPETRAVLHSGNIATEDAGSAARQTAHEDIFAVMSLSRLHKCNPTAAIYLLTQRRLHYTSARDVSNRELNNTAMPHCRKVFFTYLIASLRYH